MDQVKLARREGEKREGVDRPLKVVFRRKEDRDTVLSNAYKLARVRENMWKSVSIKADLTMKQRNMERDLEKTAASKNLTRSKEEMEDRKAWKVVGKRGEKVIRMVKLYQDEEVMESGRVQCMEEEEGSRQRRGEETRKRGRRASGSKSPSSRREVRVNL